MRGFFVYPLEKRDGPGFDLKFDEGRCLIRVESHHFFLERRYLFMGSLEKDHDFMAGFLLLLPPVVGLHLGNQVGACRQTMVECGFCKLSRGF